MATLITKNSSTASAVPAAGDLVKGELAVNVTDKKVYTKDNSAAVVKLVGSLGNQEANAVAITGGAINGTTIGATTPSTGAFTTASASSGFTGNLTGNVTGNVSGTAANVTGVVAIANGGTGLSSLGTGVQSALGQAVTGSGGIVLATSPSLTTPNLGTPSAAVLTNATGLPLTTGVTGTLGVANGGTGITAFGTGVATALGQNVTGSGGIVLATSPSLTTPNLGTPSAATLTNATGLPISTGVSGLGTGVATALAVNTGSAGAFVVNGGALGTPSSGTVTNLTGTASININGTVGATTPTTGAFTTLSASGNITVSGGTANGVAYLNGSKVLTTGSALTFTGTNFGIGVASPVNKFAVASSGVGYEIDQTSIANTNLLLSFDRGASAYRSVANYYGGNYIWNDSGSEQMRLTSTGLGIGTSSPAVKLDVSGAVRSSSSYFLGAATDGSTGQFAVSGGSTYLDYQGSLFFRSAAASTRLTLDSSGNLGLGVTPSAWGTQRALDFAYGGLSIGTGLGVELVGNTFWNGTNWIYKTTGPAFRYEQDSAGHKWYNAASGTAGNTISFTQAMTLNANGVLALQGGNTSANGVGITFPATQSASSDANTLDDYEEGTWTPNQGSGLTVSGTFSSTGSYTKIGNLVYVRGYVSGSSSVSVTAAGVISTNLPFTNAIDCCGGNATNYQVNQTSGVYISGNSTTFYANSAITASAQIIFGFTYRV